MVLVSECRNCDVCLNDISISCYNDYHIRNPVQFWLAEKCRTWKEELRKN